MSSAVFHKDLFACGGFFPDSGRFCFICLLRISRGHGKALTSNISLILAVCVDSQTLDVSTAALSKTHINNGRCVDILDLFPASRLCPMEMGECSQGTSVSLRALSGVVSGV